MCHRRGAGWPQSCPTGHVGRDARPRSARERGGRAGSGGLPRTNGERPEPRPPMIGPREGRGLAEGRKTARSRSARPAGPGRRAVARVRPVPALEVRSEGLQVRVDLQESGQLGHVGQGGLQMSFRALVNCRRSRHLRRSPSSRGPRGSSGPSRSASGGAEPGEPRRATADLPFIAAQRGRGEPGTHVPSTGPRPLTRPTPGSRSGAGRPPRGGSPPSLPLPVPLSSLLTQLSALVSEFVLAVVTKNKIGNSPGEQ